MDAIYPATFLHVPYSRKHVTNRLVPMRTAQRVKASPTYIEIFCATNCGKRDVGRNPANEPSALETADCYVENAMFIYLVTNE